MNIKEAIDSDNPLIQFFAIIDRRCGRRTLEKLDISNKLDFIKKVYDVRMKNY